MSQLEHIQSKVEDLARRYKAANGKKSRFAGLLQAKRQQLAELAKEITEAGYDPKKLKEQRDNLEAQVISQIEDFEKKLTKVEEALEAYEQDQ